MERAASVAWLHVHLLLQDFFVTAIIPLLSMVLSTIKLYCMGDLPKYWVDRIEWLGYATNPSKLVSYIQVSISLALPDPLRTGAYRSEIISAARRL